MASVELFFFFWGGFFFLFRRFSFLSVPFSCAMPPPPQFDTLQVFQTFDSSCVYNPGGLSFDHSGNEIQVSLSFFLCIYSCVLVIELNHFRVYVHCVHRRTIFQKNRWQSQRRRASGGFFCVAFILFCFVLFSLSSNSFLVACTFEVGFRGQLRDILHMLH